MTNPETDPHADGPAQSPALRIITDLAELVPDPVPARMRKLTGDVEELQRRLAQTQQQLAAREKELAAAEQELERIRKTLKK